MASVKVAVRVRPFNQRELDMGAELIVAVDGKKTRILNHKVAQGKDGDLGRERFKDFTFDHSYWSFDEMDNNFASQEMLFADLGTEVVDSAYEGYNACVFAYGQTGSGKTFTMMGSPDCEGLIPRICQTLFTRMSDGKEKGVSYRTEVSYLEIYNERVKDLLQPSDHHALRVREHPRLGPYVQDLSYHLVTDYHHIQALMQRGNARRTTASTAMNNTSSRSHAIFTLTFAQAGLDTEMLPSETTSKVHLVDLAGSERADTSGATGQRLKEGAHINKSLVTLGSVISALAELSGIGPRKSGSVFIPYRDSVLTWLLKDSLGGNSKTIMIAAISPADCNYGETLSTLRYANRAKNIINKPTINEDPNVKLIRDLREEISKLKSLLDTEQSVETQVLERELHQMEAQEKSLTEEWTEKWRETQQILQEQRTLGLRKAGLGVVLDSDTPHLVGIDDDLLSTGVTLYHLRDGDTRIGTDEANEAQDILLNGNGVEAEHCRVVLTRGVATLIPAPHAQCWVNTVAVDRPTKLSQGCIILLGRTNMFRYNDPVEAAKMRKEGSRSHLNLSRLSLLSFSTPDLAACSTESLWSPHAPTVSEEQELDEQRTALTIDRETFQREQAEREAEWEREQQDKRESLEQAQKELERERHKLEKEYAAQCRRLAQDWRRLEKHQLDNLAVMRAREAELNRRREVLLEEHSGEQQQIEYECSRVAELRAEVVSRMRQFASVVSQELRLVQKTSGTNGLVKPVTHCVKPLQVLAAEKLACESSKTPISDTSSESFASLTHDRDSFKCLLHTHKRDVLDLEAEIRSRVATAMERRVNISRLETEIADIDCSLEAGCSELREMRETLATRSQLQLRQLAEKKQSMSLDLKRSISVCRPDSEDSSDLQESPAMTLDTLSSSLSTADTFHTATSPAPDPVNPGATKTSASTTTEAELGNSNGISSNGISSNGISSNRTSSNGISSNGIDCNGIDSNGVKSNGVESNGVRQASDDSEVSSTEYVHKRAAHSSSSFEKVSPLSEIQNGFRVRRPRSHGGKYCREASVSQLMRAMKRLCLRVTQQKMLVMQSLDNDCPKSELDAHIALLQDYQRQYVRLEVALDRHPLRPLTLDNVASSEDSDNMSTSADDGMSELIGDGRSRLDDDGFRDNTSSADGGLTSPAFSAVSSHDTSPAGPPLPPPPLLSVPGYMVRGTGRQTHYEYEVQVACSGGERWSLMRRYKRFRELHLTMRLRYGSPVDALSFPPRVFFSNNSESVSRRRRADLESYLRQLIDTCSRIASCPLHDCRAGGTTKMALLEFSAFFRKGVFETGKYGTS